MSAGMRAAGGSRLSPDAVVLALDLGGTQTRAAAILPDGGGVARRAAPTPTDPDPEAIFAACAALLTEVRNDLPSELRERVAAIGISSMGPVDPWRGSVVDPPNVPSLRDAPLADEMERRVGLPAWLDKDTNVAALAELWLGAARGCRDFLYVTVSTGLGAAIVRDGGVLLGPDGSAGELGHICLMPVDGPRCGCGGSGHLEAIASGSGLAAQARQFIETGRLANASSWRIDGDGGGDPGLAPLSPGTRSDYLSARARRGAITGRDVAEGEEAGDEVCRLLMSRARRAFAVACVGWVDAFNPERIVVGGAVAESQGERWLAPARDEIAGRAFSVPAARVRVVPAELGPDVGLVGARPLVAGRFGVDVWRARRPASAAGEIRP
jgi:glucokinase